MSFLHLFYPQNDLALARNLSNFTAPPAARRLAAAGAALPLWYGKKGDRFIEDGINARWYGQMTDTFGIGVEPYDGLWTNDLEPAPWGWSKASRRYMSLRGVPQSALPDDDWLNAVRDLSHRRTAAEISAALADDFHILAPAAQELTSYAQIEQYVRRNGPTMLKLPWSSSGRGLIPVSSTDLASRRQAIEGALIRQGGIMAELKVDKTMDFALLYTISSEGCAFDGFSVFSTTANGVYTGNFLASNAVLHDVITARIEDMNLDNLVTAVGKELYEVAKGRYAGPIGVDFVTCQSSRCGLALVEINFRMTMGHVARRLYDRYIDETQTGIFAIKTAPDSEPDNYTVFNGRLKNGIISLTPPGGDFVFEVTVGC